jgi:1-acyl-sn-glycerol-3-phosphate acyltransferase
MGTGLNAFKWAMKALYHLHLLRIALHGMMVGYFLYFRIKNNLKTVGDRYLPSRNREPVIIAINHSSGADAYIGLATIGGKALRWGSFVAHEKSFRKDTFEKWLLLAFGAIPRIGSGQRVINRMVYWLCRNRNIYIVPEGMTSDKVMRGYTGIMRVYYLANKIMAKHGRRVGIMPVATIGANKCYPITVGPDGKYHPQKGGIILRVGPPIHFDLPESPTKDWFREKTDLVMNRIAWLARQREGIIDSWKLNSMQDKPRDYKL